MKLGQEINNTRDMIDGELNRIMVTDDIEEIRGLTYYLFCNINDLIRTKKISEECDVSKDSTIFNRHIRTVVDRALNGEHFTSEEDVSKEMLKDAFTELINNLFTQDEEGKKKDEE